MSKRSLTLGPAEYVQHINRLYNAVEHLLGWLKRISLAKQESPGQWIPDFLDDLERLNTTIDPIYDAIQQPYIRLLIQDEHMHLKAGFVFESTRQTTSLTKVPPHNIVIGFYFPPEDYPMIDGKYPTIIISINNLMIALITLDGTRRLYKPVFKRFWLHKNLLPLNQLYINTDNRPYHVVQVFDSVNLYSSDEDSAKLKVYTIGNQRMSYSCGSIGFNWDNYDGHTTHVVEKEVFDTRASLEYVEQCKNPMVFSYAYLRAANIIKRCWIRHHLRKKREIVGAEIRILPDIGADMLELANKYNSSGVTTSSNSSLSIRAQYDEKLNLERRRVYVEEGLRLLLRLPLTQETEQEIHDTKFLLSFIDKQLVN